MSAANAPPVREKAHVFQGFAEASRLLILEALRDGEKTVSDICAQTRLGQPNASNHLACLLGCRLVEREQRGRFAYYRLADDRVEALLALVDEIASGRADAPSCPVCGSDAW